MPGEKCFVFGPCDVYFLQFLSKDFFAYFRFLGVFKFMLMAVLHLAPFSRVSVVSISDSRKSN